jgi:hypothetical protein
MVLKYADSFHGADRAVAEAIGFKEHIEAGQFKYLTTPQLAAKAVVFLGVGPLRQFRYAEIQEFSAKAIGLTAVLASKPKPEIVMTIHGPGYGLDPQEAFLAQLAGLSSGVHKAAVLRAGSLPARITIAESNIRRAELLEQLISARGSEIALTGTLGESGIRGGSGIALITPNPPSNVVELGRRANQRPRLFVAMPFADEWWDEFEIAFQEASHANEFLCERMDVASFVGDVVQEMQHRIAQSSGVIALLNGLNPNVFLELGFAMALRKPVILVVKKGDVVPFDVRGHRHISYSNISGLRQTLTREIGELKSQGVLAKVV